MDEALLDSPLGTCRILANAEGLVSVAFVDKRVASKEPTSFRPNRHIEQSLEELDAYFSGQLTRFNCRTAPIGTQFQKRVWQRLIAIPFGATKSYGQIAAELGQPTAARAVGGANNRNPLPIIIPCHRVIGSGKTLIGYACGLWRKQWMLEHEGIALPLG
ncbi:methylated-DNA--[protein]-cysteine S-methyltransferase [Pelagicoccus sp. SDUM812002]|uniref:methylated-DNA--[protein]-cysteine S-methyltransferase n=1 Tax=Pelagicoccus sp. SDUM812002 TaxID=3041266 RepID=UPI00280E8672|nr:methylated-DNA--[protein]-cysteine S-methyltransferase [Pelagicoccus sp. SDUM812002]MDQ8185509.1 methylated-DNA--[protein]-cysteine S-methyltransferase [Pelagicoccus sp. SDUM812002]